MLSLSFSHPHTQIQEVTVRVFAVADRKTFKSVGGKVSRRLAWRETQTERKTKKKHSKNTHTSSKLYLDKLMQCLPTVQSLYEHVRCIYSSQFPSWVIKCQNSGLIGYKTMPSRHMTSRKVSLSHCVCVCMWKGKGTLLVSGLAGSNWTCLAANSRPVSTS